MNKKILIVVVIIFGIIAVAFGVYFAVKKAKEIATPPEGGVPAGYFGGGVSGVPAETKEKLQIVSDQPAFDYWITGDILNKNATTSVAEPSSLRGSATATSTILSDASNKIFYFNENGQILKAIDNKEDEMISDRNIENLQSIEANKDGSLVIVKYGLANSPKFEIFDIAKKVWTIYENISALTFSPDGDKIAYLENDAGNSMISNLIIKDLIGKKPKTNKILSFNQEDFSLKWLAADKILLVPRPSYQIAGEIWAIDIKKKTISLFSSGNGVGINWAKDASLGLRFSSNQTGEGNLSLIGSDGLVKASLGFSALPEKCFVSLVKIYCALPQSSTAIKSPTLPDDYLKRAVYYSDYLYGIDVQTNSFSPVFSDLNFNIDYSHLSLSNNSLLFMNRYDKKVYKLNL